MYGISTQSKEAIDKVIGNLFDKASLRFLGDIPKLRNKRYTLVGFEQSPTLSNLFVQSMNNKWLNNVEQDVLKGILIGALAYITILKDKTSNAIAHELDSLARESRIAGDKISEEKINEIIEKELSKAKSHMEMITASEGTKTRNLGMAMDVARKSAAIGEKDPIVFFNVIRDNSTCPICIKLCLMPDKVTPRLYRLSELGAGYYKRGDTTPSILGQHPHCRCTIAYLPTNWGFNKNGHVTFVNISHNELNNQRESA